VATPKVDALRRYLKDPQSVREAIVLQEILSAPACLRRTGFADR